MKTKVLGLYILAILAGSLTGFSQLHAYAASISGFVYDSGGNDPVLAGGISVEVYSYDGDTCWGNWVDSGDKSTDGSYTISGLAPGTYYLKTDNYGSSNYVDEYWADGASTPDCNQAQTIEVTSGGDAIVDKNFQLDEGTSISGFVSDSSGDLIGADDIDVEVYSYDGDTCLGNWIKDSSISADDGSYTIHGIAPGTYVLKTWNWGSTNYIDEYWAFDGSTPDCSQAQTLDVVSGEPITGKNFQLDEGATISGTVYDSSGNLILGEGIQVNLQECGEYGCFGNGEQGHVSTENGSFLITGISPGKYALRTYNYGTTNYVDEYWVDPEGSLYEQDAERITVGSGEVVTGKDFRLDLGASVSGVIKDSNGNPITGHYLRISVHAYDENPCSGFYHARLKDDSIDTSTGNYSINGIPAQPVFLKTQDYSKVYSDEFLGFSTSSSECRKALPLVLEAEQNLTDKNFQLDETNAMASISGTVRDANGAIIDDGVTYIDLYEGEPCGDYVYQASIGTASDGTYSITGVQPGSYFLKTFYYGDSSYISEYWADPESLPNCEGAQLISVSEGEAVTGKDFQIDSGATISGTVLDNGENPIEGVSVRAKKGDPCGDSIYLEDTYSGNEDQGNYILKGIAPADNIFIVAEAYDENLIREFWAPSGSSPDCLEAEYIEILGSEAITDRNFNLDQGATITGTVTEEDGSPIVIENGTYMYILSYAGSSCDGKVVSSAYVNQSDGSYSIDSIPTGTVYLAARNYSTNYIDEYWTASSSSPDCNNAEGIIIHGTETIEEYDFQIDEASTLSGIISDMDSNPVFEEFLKLTLFSGDQCSSPELVQSVLVDPSDGSFSFSGLEIGDYSLEIDVYSGHYQNGWWADPESVLDCSSAQTISVNTLGQSIGNNNTKLEYLLKGDANYDKYIDLKDAIIALQVLTGENFNIKSVKSIDVNGDGILNIPEVLTVLEKVQSAE